MHDSQLCDIPYILDDVHRFWNRCTRKYCPHRNDGHFYSESYFSANPFHVSDGQACSQRVCPTEDLIDDCSEIRLHRGVRSVCWSLRTHLGRVEILRTPSEAHQGGARSHEGRESSLHVVRALTASRDESHPWRLTFRMPAPCRRTIQSTDLRIRGRNAIPHQGNMGAREEV